ncbi:hypothetical protein [Clostridium sp. JN-9]|uniref:hypothetical protein n=1 Tax=Clostridium sp. JN-9 TaxID=2507159 RepID=UPI000FFE2D7B|nr:hypothetical protein [Clostridium sp. JN-9]QAT39532.1 hypothetical protein EQM05_04295 [Clostridium sp. JN-9]
MFHNMYNLFFNDDYETFNVHRKSVEIDNGLRFDVEIDNVIGTVDVDIQEKTKITNAEGKQQSEAGIYVVKYILGYTAPTVDIKEEDILENTNRKLEVVNIFNKKDFILLYLREVK